MNETFEKSAEKFLKEGGAYPLKSREENYNIFCYFVNQDNEYMVKILASNIEDVDFRLSDGSFPQCTPLGYAARKNFIRIAKTLLAKGANPDIGYGCLENSPLQLACENNSLEMVGILLKAGADVNKVLNIKDDKGRVCFAPRISSLLHKVCYQYSPNQTNLELIKILLENKANTRFVNYFGETALFYANYPEVIELLLQFGSEINHQSKAGETALLKLIISQRNDCVDLLLKNGSDLKLRTTHGRSAFYHAIKCKNIKALKLMLMTQNIDVDEHFDDIKYLHYSEDEWQATEQAELIDVLVSYSRFNFLENLPPQMVRPFIKSYITRRMLPTGFESLGPAKVCCTKLHLLGFRVSNRHLRAYEIFRIHSLKNLDEFKKELMDMKIISLSTYPKTVLYDVFFFEPPKMAVFSINTNLLKIYEECNKDFRNVFPFFGPILNYKLKKGIIRYELTILANNALSSILARHLPEDCSQIILKYFNESQLKLFATHDWDRTIESCDASYS